MTLLSVCDCGFQHTLGHSQLLYYYYVRDQNNHNAIERIVIPLFHQFIDNLLIISSSKRLQYQKVEVKER